MNKFEQGLSLHQQESIIQTPDIPAVTRDERGRIRWNLPGNTQEENEQLGIRNVQALFLQKFPQFDELFPREEDGKVSNGKQEQAKKFILDNIKSSRDLTNILKISISSSVPYFGRSYVVVLQKSFKAWGININPDEYKNQPWSIDRIEREAIKFFQEEGMINQRLLSERDKAGLVSAITKYYPGKMKGLKIKLGIIIKEKPEGYWTKEKIEQEAKAFLEQEGDITHPLLRSKGRFDLAGAISGKYPGSMATLKTKLGVAEKSKPHGYWTKERIEEEARDFLDQEGKISYSLLKKRGNSDLSHAISKNYPDGLTGLRKILGTTEGRIPNNYWTKERIEEEAKKFFDEEGDLSQKILHKKGKSSLLVGIYSHYPGKLVGLKKQLGIKENRRPMGYWTPAKIESEITEFFRIEREITYVLLAERNRYDLVRAVGKHYPGGMPALREKLGIGFKSKPVGYWTPEKIEQEARVFWQQEGNLSQEALANKGRYDLINAVAHYPDRIIGLRKKLNLPELRKPNAYWTEEKIEEEIRIFLEQEGDLSSSLLTKRKKGHLLAAIHNYYPGGLLALKSKFNVESKSKPSGYWTKEIIEEKAREFFQKEGDLNQRLLNENGMGGLSYAISKHYPGQFTALKEKLRIVPKSETTITPEQANAELMRLLEQGEEWHLIL